MKLWTKSVAVAALTTLGLACATALAPNAFAAPLPPTFTASSSGQVITVTVTNPNEGEVTFPPDSICFPLIYEYVLFGDDEFTWQPDPVDHDQTDPLTAQKLTDAGFALPGASATSSVEVPRDGLYVVGAACSAEDGESFAERVQPVVIGPVSGGTPITAAAVGDRITATVTNNTTDSECTVHVVRLSMTPQPVFTPDAPTDFAFNPGDTATITTGPLTAGHYAVSGICSDGTYSTPPAVIEIGAPTPTPDDNCFGSLCAPLVRLP